MNADGNYQYFQLELKKGFIEMESLFMVSSKEAIEEANLIFSYLYFHSKANVRIHLGRTEYVCLNLLGAILQFANGMTEKKKTIYMIYPPDSLRRYIRRFSIKTIHIQDTSGLPQKPGIELNSNSQTRQ